ncbi:unnamed protein product [Owenia fusiformis]|uniref:Uncharacterized protein n=1 Tax=Owenia fusiformis TaxID=6347 RepID=A0A8J1UK13_OWEFU|nr:unnamed protein product [Owenia fusiformis]
MSKAYMKRSSSPNKHWPTNYGFEIVGDGPSYVISVDHLSMAQQAGILPGDQLLEIDKHDVTNMSANAIKTLAKHSRTIPPALGVVSRMQYIELLPSRKYGYGINVYGDKPVYVEILTTSGPAYRGGLRTGDILLEANCRKVRRSDSVKPILNACTGKLTVGLIAIEINKKNMVPEGKYDVIRTAGSRVKKARELFKKMNNVLGADYEKKMAIVGVLKQYAEDRKVKLFSNSIMMLLKTQNQRKLLPEIRPFVPVKHRAVFDDILQHDPLQPYLEMTGTFSKSSGMAVQYDDKRTVNIDHSEGNFGFILRGHSPVYIESIEPGGPADRAGLLPGDCILKLNGLDVRRSAHTHVVKLLQCSGSSPSLDVVQLPDDGEALTGSESVLSSDTSSSSGDSSGWLSDITQIIDTDGKSFREKVEDLLTSKEKGHLKKSLLKYNIEKNIGDFVIEVSAILDTPSKKTMWGFIIPRLSTEHQKFIIQHINVPSGMLKDLLPGNILNIIENTERKVPYNSESTEVEFSLGNSGNSSWLLNLSKISHLGSFKQQLEYLLTSRERSQLKKALQFYSERRNVHNLLEDLVVILDTPSKRTLWYYIIPLLSEKHQHYSKKKLKLNKEKVKAGSAHAPVGYSTSESYQSALLSVSSFPSQLNSVRAGDKTPLIAAQEGDVMYSHGFTSDDLEKLVSENSLGSDQVSDIETFLTDDTDITDNKAPKKTHKSHRLKKKLLSKGDYDGSSGKESAAKLQKLMDYDRMHKSNSNITYNPLFESESMRSHITRVKEVCQQTSPAGTISHINNIAIQNNSLSSNASNQSLQMELSNASATTRDSSNTETQQNGRPSAKMHNAKRNSVSTGMQAGVVSAASAAIDAQVAIETHPKRNDRLSSQVQKMTIVEHPTEVSSNSENDSDTLFGSVKSVDSFNAKAMQALRTLDECVAGEGESDMEGQSSSEMSNITTAHPPPPPPPPPPAPAPPTAQEISVPAMNVKRINWEKLDIANVQNTVWGQLNDSEYLDDVLKYLELEQQFSTKKTKVSQSFREMQSKKQKVILNPKKAYNISIVLGHLKTPVPDIKQSLYKMDEDLLTPELLRQLLAYAPSSDEMDKYDGYTGKFDDLSKADQFVYQLSRVPGYMDRLKAMYFKASFAEKSEEIRQCLSCLKKASIELRQSKKMAKVLELVLAMGNYMNKGNQRVGEASAFRISFLTQLELTKTSDNKATFLHVLANAIYTKFPDMLPLIEDLPTVAEAAKVSSSQINQELLDLRKVLQEISTTLTSLGSHNYKCGVNDRFQEIMGRFINESSDEIQKLFTLQVSAHEEFTAMVQFYGENPKTTSTNEIFGIFADFITKFEKAHTHNLLYKKH